MKKKLLIILLSVFTFSTYSQIDDGSVAPDFTATDLQGNTHSLSSYLNAGKTVILNISATWCGPCWNYKQTGALSDVYYSHGPDGSDEVVLLYVEGDASTGIAELNGSGNTVGDWVSSTPFPIIDDASIASDYEITYFPTVYRICPDGYVYEMGQLDNTDIVNNINTNCSTTLQGQDNHLKIEVDDISLCNDGVTADFNVTVKNLGNNAINSFDLDVISGSNITSVSKTASLNSTFDEQSFTINAPLDSGVSNSIELINVNGNSPFVSDLNSVDLNVSATSAQTDNTDVEVHVYTDNYPGEISWELKDEQGNVVASGGPYQEGNDDEYGGGGPDALTTKIHNVTLSNIEQCYSLELLDEFGDGWAFTDGSITPGVEIFADGESFYSTGEVGNFGDGQSYFNAFKYTTNLSVDNFEKYDFTMYPNPTNGLLNLSANQSFEVKIFDLNGKLVFNDKLNESQQLDLSHLSPGVYLTKISINKVTKTNKLIIK